MAACSNMNNSLTARNDEMCYNFNDTMSWLYSTYGYDMCILGHMGWFNDDGTYNWDQWIADIASLPEEVAGVNN